MSALHDHEHEPYGAISPDVGHLHARLRPPAEEKIARLRWAVVITGAVMLIEVAGGLATHSLALLSDAAHMFTHIFALGMSYLAIRVSARPANVQKTFGYFRSEVLAAFVNGLFLFGVTGYIFYEGIGRIAHGPEVLPGYMLIVALAGLAANGASVMLLFRVSGEDLNLRSAFVHVVYDTASSVAVVGAAAVIHFTRLHWLDPAVSMLIGVLIVAWAARIVWDSAHILLESTPPDVHMASLRRDIESVDGVVRIHDVHVWQITTDMYVLTAHIVVEDMPVSRTADVVEEINHILREHHKIGHTTLQLEHGVPESEERAISPREYEGRDGVEGY
jgi:cobalt-zinc-cadmium efflux system protein